MDGKDCDALLEELEHYLHGELSSERRAALRDHLDDCPPCFDTADFQDQLRKLIAKRCGEQVPDGLKGRIEALLTEPGAFAGPDPSS